MLDFGFKRELGGKRGDVPKFWMTVWSDEKPVMVFSSAAIMPYTVEPPNIIDNGDGSYEVISYNSINVYFADDAANDGVWKCHLRRTDTLTDFSQMFRYVDPQYIYIDDLIQTEANTSLYYCFYTLSNLIEPPNVSNWDTSNVTNLNRAFYIISGITTPPDVSNWDTSKVTTIDSCFTNMLSITVPPDVSSWNTSNVENMYRAFYRLENIVEPPNVSNWDTSKVTNLSHCFVNLLSITTPPDVSNWDTSEVNTLESCFMSMLNITAPPDVSNWDTSEVITIDRCFMSMLSITVPPDVSSWNTSNVENMYRAFYKLENIVESPDVSNWDTSKVNDISECFYNLSIYSRSEIDDLHIENWNIGNIASAVNFLLNVKLATSLYDQILINWANQPHQNDVEIHFGNSKYTAGGEAEAARQQLIDDNWTIFDGGTA